jgi:hypothetical protein
VPGRLYRVSTLHWFRHTTLCKTPLDKCLDRRRDFYLTKHNNHNKQSSTIWRDSNPQSHQAAGRRQRSNRLWQCTWQIIDNLWKVATVSLELLDSNTLQPLASHHFLFYGEWGTALILPNLNANSREKVKGTESMEWTSSLNDTNSTATEMSRFTLVSIIQYPLNVGTHL